jgi:UDP-2,3-diacylglucosamine pyrophosphatase LpxH
MPDDGPAMASEKQVENDDGTKSRQNGSKLPGIIEIEKAIVVSDVHLGYNKSNVSAFISFLTRCVEDGTASDHALFILGDLWDYWRDHDAIFSQESDIVLSLVNRFKEVYYAPGNHDHVVLHARKDYPDYSCYNIDRYFRVKSGDRSFFMLHGHELDVIAKLTYMTVDEYEKLSDQLCRMNDEEGKVASYLHDIFHRLVPGRQLEVNDILQPAEQRRGMDSIDKFARSKAKYPLLGMQLEDTLIFGHTHRPFVDPANQVVNTGGWISDMLVPAWFKEQPGNDDKECSGWYVRIDRGDYGLVPYDIHHRVSRKEEEERSKAESKEPYITREEAHDGEGKSKPAAEAVAERIVQQTSDFVSDLLGKKPKEQR